MQLDSALSERQIELRNLLSVFFFVLFSVFLSLHLQQLVRLHSLFRAASTLCFTFFFWISGSSF